MSDARLCLALDVSTTEEATKWVERTRGTFGVYKIGLELFCAEGRSVIDAVRSAGAPAVFLDLKLHDIPRTVERSVSRLVALGVDYLTIHTGGGRAMMAAAAQAAGKDLRLLGVTILTSFDDAALREVGVLSTPADAAVQRATLAIDSGVTGLVCSAQEAAQIRTQLGSVPYLVTPGIRLQGGDVGDQKRVMTPSRAIEAGSNLLVIGRMITGATDLQRTLLELHGDLSL